MIKPVPQNHHAGCQPLDLTTWISVTEEWRVCGWCAVPSQWGSAPHCEGSNIAKFISPGWFSLCGWDRASIGCTASFMPSLNDSPGFRAVLEGYPIVKRDNGWASAEKDIRHQKPKYRQRHCRRLRVLCWPWKLYAAVVSYGALELFHKQETGVVLNSASDIYLPIDHFKFRITFVYFG